MILTMSRLKRSAALLVVTFLITAIPGAYAQQSPSVVTASDSFETKDYKGSNGTERWSKPWREVGERDGHNRGFVQAVVDPTCDGSACLLIDGGTTGFSGSRGLFRSVKLGDDISHGTLRFDYFRVAGSGSLQIALSGDSGATYTTVAVVSLDETDQRMRSVNVDAGDSLGNGTVVRFLAVDLTPGTMVYIDDVLLTAVEAPVATTTTTTTTTTTRPPGPTTTTTTTIVPPTTTTITIPPPPTTTSTTHVPRTTTTTTTTTQAPPRTTTTTTSTTEQPGPTTTTTTKAPPTTTTTSPSGGSPIGATTSTTSGATTTTSTSTTTTTVPPPIDVQAGGLTGLPPEGAAGLGLTSEELADYLSKSSLVIRSAPAVIAESLIPQLSSPILTPLEGLSIGVSTSVENLQGTSISALLLGLLVAWLGIRGIDHRSRKSGVPRSRLPA